MRQLFIEELETVTGGHHRDGHGNGKPSKPPKCPQITTLACGEEANGCSGC